MTWCASTHSHSANECLVQEDKIFELEPNLQLHLLHCGSYRQNIGPGRVLHHLRFAIKLYRVLRQMPEQDLIVCSLPIVETLASCQFHCFCNSVPLVIDIRDPWPDIFLTRLPKKWVPLVSVALVPYYLITRFCFRLATSLVAISPALLDWAVKAGRRRAGHNRVITHGCSDLERPSQDESWPSLGFLDTLAGEPLLVSFVGSFGHFYDLETVLEAAESLQNDPRFHFVLAGDGPLLAGLKKLGSHLQNVSFPGWLEKDEMNYLLLQTDIGLVPYSEDFLGNKVFELMAARLPILATQTQDVTRLLERTGAGVTYGTGRADQLARELVRLSENPGQIDKLSKNSRAAFESEFSDRKVYDDYARFLEDLVDQPMDEQ